MGKSTPKLRRRGEGVGGGGGGRDWSSEFKAILFTTQIKLPIEDIISVP